MSTLQRAFTQAAGGERPDARSALIMSGALGSAVVLSVGLAWSPFLTLGAVTGLVLTVFAVMQPLLVVGLMLVIGPADLSGLTGGFKTMFTQLGGLDMNGIRLLGMTAALSLVVLAERGVARQLLRPRALFYVLLLAWCAATLSFSPDPLGGARLLLKIAYPLLVFVIMAGLSLRRQTLDRLMDAVLLGAAFLCLIVNPLYVIFGEFERNIGGWTRLQGVGVHQNPFAFYVTVVLLLSFVRFMTRRQFRYILLCAVAAFWMVLTVTRIAFAATVISLVAVGLVSAIATKQRRVLVVAAVCAAILAVPLGPPVLERTLGFMPTPLQLLGLFTSPHALYSAVNWEGRQVFWAIIYNAYIASPVVGLGLGGSSFVLQLQLPMFNQPVAHNDYLRLLADAGVIGIALFTAALIAWGRIAVRAAYIEDRTAREYALPAVGCLAALAVIGITDNAFDYYGPFSQYIGFLCGGCAAVLALREKEMNEHLPHTAVDATPPRLAWQR